MNEKDKYLIDYLNSKNSILNAYIRAFSRKGNLKSDRFLAIKQILSLVDLAQNIINKVGIKQIYINNFFNSLMIIYKKGIDEVDGLIEKYDYKKLLDEKYKKVISIINSGFLNESDNDFMNFYLIYGFINREDEEKVYKFFIKMALTKEIKISYEAFLKVILYFTKQEMTKLKVVPICQIKSYGKVKRIIKKRAIKKRISLVEEEIKALYEKGSYELLKNIFMDLYYINNYKDACNKKIDSLMIREIKEELLCFYLPNYYEDNKKYILYELNARKYANKRLSSLFSEFNIEFKNGYKFETEYEEIVSCEKETKRLYNGKEMKLDEIFKIFSSNNPKIIADYQPLIEN